MGLATAYHLARDGRRVLLLEARGIGHQEGSSHGPSRMIRLTYQSEDYIELARASFALWRDSARKPESHCWCRAAASTSGRPTRGISPRSARR